MTVYAHFPRYTLIALLHKHENARLVGVSVIKKPARRLGRPDDGSACRADILDAAVFAGAAPTLGGRGDFSALVPLAVALALNPDGSQAIRGDVAQFGLLGDPGGGFRRQIRYRPSIGVMVADGQAVGFGGFLEFLVMVVSVVGYVLDLVDQVVKVGHFI